MGDAVMHARLREGVAVVTGAGAGLGRALALELAAQGVQVAAIGRDPVALEALAAEGGGRIHPVVADVADGGQVRAAFARIIDLCLEEAVDALLIAGDLYDGAQTSMKTARLAAPRPTPRRSTARCSSKTPM